MINESMDRGSGRKTHPARQADDGSVYRIGKRVGHWLYVHVSVLDKLSAKYLSAVAAAQELTGLRVNRDFNVVKFKDQSCLQALSLLKYEDLHTVPFPSLLRSWSIRLEDGSVSERSYENSSNPPILHRKELLLSPEDPNIKIFQALTAALENAGLFRDTKRIGFRRHWQELLENVGCYLSGHVLCRFQGQYSPVPRIERQKTAIDRLGLSRPFQCLARHGYLDTGMSVFDYGCGKGDDLRLLRDYGLDIDGWDPFYLPGTERKQADVVNIGFVINVIESTVERAETLRQAFSLTRSVMSVSAMLFNETSTSQAESFGDGVVTSRGTFQKYYSQTELKDYIEEVLSEEAIAVGPGVFFVFRDKLEEQRFLRRRQQRIRFDSPLLGARATDSQQLKTEVYAELLEALWERALVLGRPPSEGDLDEELATAVQDGPGGLGKALRLLWRMRDRTELQAAALGRTEDLLVYLALNIFNGRQSRSALLEETRRDIRYFLGSLKASEAEARTLLFSAGKTEEILNACRQAVTSGLGLLDGEHSLSIHADLLDRLPPVLRVYAGCASRLIGDIGVADVIKFHIHSGKLTMLMVDDFFGRAVPELRVRIKINLRTQDIDFFEYGNGKPRSLLYLKSRLMAPDQDGYQEQLACEHQLEALGCFDFSGYGPNPDIFYAELSRQSFSLSGLQLIPAGGKTENG